MYFWINGSGMPPWAAASPLGSSLVSSAERRTMRSTPVSPTNRWCASSVSMNRHDRDSGSNALSARDSSWYLPSRSVNIVNMKNDSQWLLGSLNAPRIRGRS